MQYFIDETEKDREILDWVIQLVSREITLGDLIITFNASIYRDNKRKLIKYLDVLAFSGKIEKIKLRGVIYYRPANYSKTGKWR